MTEAESVARAQMYVDLHQPTEAIRILTSALAANPTGSVALRTLAAAHLEHSDARESSDQAARAASQAISLNPDDPQTWRILALAYSRLRMVRQAREAARTARSIAPEQWASHTTVAAVDAESNYVTEDTRASIKAALRLAPDEPTVLFCAGRVAQIDGTTREAKRFYERVLALNPEHLSARNNLAVLDGRQGNDGRALAGFLGIMALNPNASLAMKNVRFTANRVLSIVSAIVFWSNFVVGSQFVSEQLATDTGLSASGPNRLLTALAAGAAILVTGLYLALVRRLSMGSLDRLARALPHSDRFLTVWAVAIALSLALLVVAIATPNEVSADIYRALIFWLGGFYAVAFLVSVVRRWS